LAACAGPVPASGWKPAEFRHHVEKKWQNVKSSTLQPVIASRNAQLHQSFNHAARRRD
jgi:hypothetical protein